MSSIDAPPGAKQMESEMVNAVTEVPEAAEALAQQPQLAQDARMEKLGTVYFGDLLVDLHGVIKRGEADLWDVTLADTTVTLESVIDKSDGADWDVMARQAQEIADGVRPSHPTAFQEDAAAADALAGLAA